MTARLLDKKDRIGSLAELTLAPPTVGSYTQEIEPWVRLRPARDRLLRLRHSPGSLAVRHSPFEQACLGCCGLSFSFLLGLLFPGPGRSSCQKDSEPFTSPSISLAWKKRPASADVLTMQPSPAFAGKMLKVDGFFSGDRKMVPPSSQKLKSISVHQSKSLCCLRLFYPTGTRFALKHGPARGNKNDTISSVSVLEYLPATARNGLLSTVNPFGVQQDVSGTIFRAGLSYDMLWNSQARLRLRASWSGFEIPFRSLRFPRQSEQTLGHLL